MVAFIGLMPIETRAAGFTVKVAEAVMDPELIPIVVVPADSVVTTPCVPTALLMVATMEAVELQWADWVRSCIVPSVYVPAAVNCCGTPTGTLADCGVIAMETSCAAVTVSEAEPVVEPEEAPMFAEPSAMLVAEPFFTVATESLSENQVAELVRSCVLPSVNVPVAANCCVVPSATDGDWGVTAIETRAAEVTVNAVVPVIDPEAAVMLVVPGAALVAKPCLSDELLIVATELASELHWTVEVRFWVVPSVNVPVALNCWVVPNGMEGIAGVTASETRVAA